MKVTISPENKYCLTINEAASYFNIGIKRLVHLLNSQEGADILLMAGTKRLVKRKKMEIFLDKTLAI